jgi:regulator of RNase E activity RraA
MDFPTFAWGPSPIDTTGRLRVTEYNIPITIKGIPVRPSDILFCDLDGIVVVPKEVESDVIGKVLERIQEENLVRQELAEGRKISKVWDKYHIL